jgi:WD40 repeat protein
MGRLTLALLAAALVAGGMLYYANARQEAAATVNKRYTPGSAAALAADKDKPIGKPLYAASASAKNVVAPSAPQAALTDPVVMGDCRLVAFEKEEVPAQRDGVILFIGTDVADGEKVPEDRLIVIEDDKGIKHRYRKLREGDVVKVGQLLAKLDDRLHRQELAIKRGKIDVAIADAAASEASRNEAKARYDNGIDLFAKKAIPKEELNERKLVWQKYTQEYISKQRGIDQAKLEAGQAQIVVEMHEIRSSINGIIKAIYKNPGEAVKGAPSSEPVFQILNLNKLRAEGLAEEQNLPHLAVGNEVSIEVAGSQGPDQVLVSHLEEVTGVAVTRDSKFIVSSSHDATVRVWERANRSERRILKHPAAVTCVACTPPGAAENLCASACRDGNVRVFDLDKESNEPIRTIATGHRGAIHCIAFSPDGATLATGGEDRDIAIWETAKGELKYRMQGHSGGVTAVSYTPDAQLVSAGRDNTVRIWSLGDESWRLENTIGKRSGDVPQLGVSPDGKQMVFDPWQSKSLRLLSVPDGLTAGVLEEPSGAARFTTFALFAPDGKAILTAGATDSRLQLWHPPSDHARAHVRRFLVAMHQTPSCAAFSPDNNYLVVGTKERHILVWPRQWADDLPAKLTAQITYIDPSLDSHQTRIWAVLANPGAKLLPGANVTMVRYPK